MANKEYFQRARDETNATWKLVKFFTINLKKN